MLEAPGASNGSGWKKTIALLLIQRTDAGTKILRYPGDLINGEHNEAGRRWPPEGLDDDEGRDRCDSEHFEALHYFWKDQEGLGMISLDEELLGTVSEKLCSPSHPRP